MSDFRQRQRLFGKPRLHRSACRSPCAIIPAAFIAASGESLSASTARCNITSRP
jgi:hypothetical protein